MKKIMLLIILIMTIIGCTEADRQMMREVDREYKERGRKCLYTSKGSIISCRYADE